MKLLCFNKFILILLFVYSSLFGALQDKSAMVYYGDNISYPMVGIHDYIIVQPSQINTKTHGFDVYKEKMYAYVSIGEIDRDIKEYKLLKKEWILTQNKAWSSDVLDLTNAEYREFLFKNMIEPQMKRGFKNFFFDTLDSYQLAVKTDEQRAKSEEALVIIINDFHKRYPGSKLIINRGFEIIDKVHNSIEAVLFESYYHGLKGDNLAYKSLSDDDREWLDTHLKKIKSYKLDIIVIDYLEQKDIKNSDPLIQKLKNKGFIPFISTKNLDTYGRASKNAVKREIFTLIDESMITRVEQSVHTQGALPLEYMGYIQTLYDISKHPLPKMKDMHHYAGVVIWLREATKNQNELVQWVLKLKKLNIKVVFAASFSIQNRDLLKLLDIEILDTAVPKDKNSQIVYKDSMVAYEMEPSLSQEHQYYKILKGKALLTLKDSLNQKTTLAAIMPWGGFAIDDSLSIELIGDNIWVMDPFKFFAKALRLKSLIVPDVTTKNGKRLLFTHIDGDGIMNRVEWDSSLYSGDIILEEILKTYKIPHSVSVIGAEINPEGLYPKLSKRMQNITKEMYALSNVEAATHTYTHPFFWGKIINDDLDEKYHLKVKNYNFSLDREIGISLKNINKRFVPKNAKKANTVFWSGDCQPTETTLKYVYKNNILNINGGDTYISNTNPWLSYVSPQGIQRGDYYQIYTGAQNENIYTNEWLGPFWGFKKVVQTFKLTNSPRRLKPIDIYYHLYSGSKRASLNALKYVFEWSIAQDVMPIFTSEYIPMVMDYYTVSMSEENGYFLVDGMRDVKTLRVEKENVGIDFKNSQSVLGLSHFENHTYIHTDKSNKVIFKASNNSAYKKVPYLISANANAKLHKMSSSVLSMSFNGHVPLKLVFNLPSKCTLTSSLKSKRVKNNGILTLEYKTARKVKIDVICK